MIMRWLHLTDLHLGMGRYIDFWPSVEEILLEDLTLLHKITGDWDLVLFSGDLAFKGTGEEYDQVELLLLGLWKFFENELRFKPHFLAVPGNHDLTWPSGSAALTSLLDSWNNPEVQTRFWQDPNSDERKVVDSAFHAYSTWWSGTQLPRPPQMTSGLLPGEFAATYEKEGTRFGVLGLNSTFLQLQKGIREGKLALDVRQFHHACGANGPKWANEHDVCLLMTHHPPTWLPKHSKDHLEEHIYKPERFAMHLFGHLHDADLTNIAMGGAMPRLQLQGSSLFGLEEWGEDPTTGRRHGYSLCQLELSERDAKLRIWPRLAVKKNDGTRKIERNIMHFNPSDGDGGTDPIIVARHRTRPAKAGGAAKSEPQEASAEELSHDGFKCEDLRQAMRECRAALDGVEQKTVEALNRSPIKDYAYCIKSEILDVDTLAEKYKELEGLDYSASEGAKTGAIDALCMRIVVLFPNDISGGG